MKHAPKLVFAFTAGLVIASLPYTLASVKTMAQVAAPGSSGPFPPQNGMGGSGLMGQGMMGQPMPQVSNLLSDGKFLYATSGNVVYKISKDAMRIEGQVVLGQRRPDGRPPVQGNPDGRGGNRGGGLGGGGGTTEVK